MGRDLFYSLVQSIFSHKIILYFDYIRLGHGCKFAQDSRKIRARFAQAFKGRRSVDLKIKKTARGGRFCVWVVVGRAGEKKRA